jgi:spermidine/putrescine transport system permease protein
MVFVPAVSTFYISKKLGGTGTALIGDVIEAQFKNSVTFNSGAALSLALMILVLFCVFVMNHFTDDEEENEVMLL